MKKKNVMFFIFLVAVLSMHPAAALSLGTAVPIDDARIQKWASSPDGKQQLSRRLQSLLDTGYKARGTTEAGTKLMFDTAKSLPGWDVATLTKVLEAPKGGWPAYTPPPTPPAFLTGSTSSTGTPATIATGAGGAPTPPPSGFTPSTSGSVGGGLLSGWTPSSTGLGGSGAAPIGAGTGATGTGARTGMGGAGGVGATTPSVTPSAPTPVVIVAMGAAGQKMIADERASLASLSDEAKKQSDLALLETFADIAGEVGVSGIGAAKTGDLGKYKKYIVERLTKLYNNTDFKFKNALAYNFFKDGNVGTKSIDGSPFGSFVESLKLPVRESAIFDYLETLHDDPKRQNEIHAQLASFIFPTIFDVILRTLPTGIVQKTSDLLEKIIDLIWVNIIVSQRPILDISSASDSPAQQLLAWLKSQIATGDPRILQELAQRLNILRLNPSFKNFFDVLGLTVLNEVLTKMVIGQIKKFPLLEALRIDRYPHLGPESTGAINDVFNSGKFSSILKNELFLDEDAYNAVAVVIPQALLDQHKAYLQMLNLAAADPNVFLKPLSSALSIDAITKILKNIKTMLPTYAKQADAALTALNTFQKDPAALDKTRIGIEISTLLHDALPTAPAAFAEGITKNVQAVVDKEYQKIVIKSVIKDALKDAIINNKSFFDFYQLLILNPLISNTTKDRIRTVFTDPYATPRTIYDYLSSLVGGKAPFDTLVKEIFSNKTKPGMVETAEQGNLRRQFMRINNKSEHVMALIVPPYGLVTIALKNAAEQVDPSAPTEKASEQLIRLTKQLTSIFQATLPTGKVQKDFTDQINKFAIEVGLLKSNALLGALITALAAHDIETVLDNTYKLVLSIQPEVQHLNEQLLIMRNVLYKLEIQLLVEFVSQLNTGKVSLPALPKAVSGLINPANEKVYAAMRNKFGNLLNILQTPEAVAGVTPAQFQKVVTEILNVVPANPANARTAFETYLRTLGEQIAHLQPTATLLAADRAKITAAEAETKRREAEEEKRAAAEAGVVFPTMVGGAPIAPPPPEEEEEPGVPGEAPAAPPL